jgi:hypothetical protein
MRPMVLYLALRIWAKVEIYTAAFSTVPVETSVARRVLSIVARRFRNACSLAQLVAYSHNFYVMVLHRCGCSTSWFCAVVVAPLWLAKTAAVLAERCQCKNVIRATALSPQTRAIFHNWITQELHKVARPYSFAFGGLRRKSEPLQVHYVVCPGC